MRKRILYVMHVDWNWIKQRPHFIAEHLATTHDILVSCPLAKNRAALSRNSKDNVRVWPFLRLPRARKVILLHGINRVLLRIYFRIVLKIFRPDYVWLTFPDLFDYLPDRLEAKLIYDCMDDALAFDANTARRALLARLEQELVQKTAHVFCSSGKLAEKLQLRTACGSKCTVVHNAFSALMSDFDPTFAPPITKPSGIVLLGYIGTISNWLDLDALLACVQHFKNVEVHLLGPIDQLDVGPWQHDRLVFHGPVAHSSLPAWARCLDILVMPFKVTELVESVDPVKLYEYILFDKPIITVRYPEIERFAEFVRFYSGRDELFDMLDLTIKSGCTKKYSNAARELFLKENAWDSRAAQMRLNLS